MTETSVILAYLLTSFIYSKLCEASLFKCTQITVWVLKFLKTSLKYGVDNQAWLSVGGTENLLAVETSFPNVAITDMRDTSQS